MIKTTKKLWMVMCLFVATICVSVGGIFALLQTTRAQADDTVIAEFTDFEVEGVGAIHNHFYSDIGLFYQLTLDFSQEGLAFNQHASAVSGITFNGVPMTCGGAPSGDSIMVITLNSGLWIHYTVEQSISGYKGYSHPTIHFTEGATVTDVNGVTMTYAELTFYLVNGEWTTTRPENYKTDGSVNYTPNFVSIGGVNHMYNDILVAYGLSLIYDTTGFATEGAQVVASSATGFSLNGEEIGVALWGGNQLLFWLPANKCESNYNGYSHPTLAILDGAKVTNEAGKEFTFGGITLYLVDGAWTTTRPDGYAVEMSKATFVDFLVEGVGGIRNNFYNENFYEVTLDFDQGGLAFNAHASAVSGITFNGIPMTCGGEPSGDSIMVITLNSGLWIHYTAEQSVSGYKGYSHATIEFENGATVTDANGTTITYAELTLYLVNGAWTATQPDGYHVEAPKATFVNFTIEDVGATHNHFFETNGSFYKLTLKFDQDGLAFNAHASAVSGMTFNGIPMTCGGVPSEDSIMVLTLGSGLWIHYTIEQAETYYKGYSHATIEFENGATVTDANGKTITYAELTLYLVNGAWTTTRPEGYKIDDGVNYTPDFISVGTLNHVYSDGIDAYGVALNYSTLGFEPDGGMHTALSSMGFSMNGEEIGVALWGENKVLLWLAANKCEADYNGYSHPTIVIVEGAIVTNTAGEEFTLGGVTLYLVDGKWTTSRPDGYEIKVGELLPYNGIAHGWNNAIYHGVSNTILCFGEYIRNENNEIIKCDFLGADNGTESHADPSNLANPFANAPIATVLTVNGKPIGELYKQDSRVEVSYAHGYNYLLIAIPEYMLVPDGRGCVTLHIEDNTVFKNCLLSEVTLYLHEGEWTSTKPDIVEGEDAEYTTVSNLFGEATKEFNGEATVESQILANDSVIYKFLLKNESIANTVIFSTHYTTEFDGIKVLFTGDSTTGRENVLLFVNGREIAVASYMWTESEWFTVRITVDVEETLSISIAIDGVYYIKATDVAKDGLGTKIGVQNEKGNNAIADYKVGDIKNPILYWQGDAEYLYEVNTAKPEDSEFKALVTVADNKDGVMDASNVQVLWQDGAITDGKLNEGTWFVTLSISDLAGNIAQRKITIIVEDPTKVTVTFDGVPTETVYHIGELLVEPVAPTKQGYVFEGWYVGDVKWDFANDVVSSNLSLTSKYSKATYTVVLTSEGLDENYTNTFELEYGETLNQTTLVRDGYTYELYLGDIKVQSVIVESDMNVKVVYKAVEDNPITPPETSESTNGDNSSASSSQSESLVNQKKGCKGMISFGGIGVMLALVSAITLFTKKKKN